MVNIEAKVEQPRLPANVAEQLQIPYSSDAKLTVCIGFRDDILNLLEAQSIEVVDSTFRVKSPQSIWGKVFRRLAIYQSFPVEDQYGVRVITTKVEEVHQGVMAIRDHYNRYDNLRWGWIDVPPYIKDRSSADKPKHSHPEYRACHVIVPFGSGPILFVGEVQLMANEWRKQNDRTRRYFERQQGRQYWQKHYET